MVEDESSGAEDPMPTQDRCCTIAPYFRIHDGKLADFRALCERFLEKSSTEPKCLYYGFSFSETEAHCREGYEDADGVLAHVNNVGDLLQQALTIADIVRLEIHGPAEELAKLREPLKPMNPTFFVLEYGFRR
jgi:quinol monooxygenase YgiN